MVAWKVVEKVDRRAYMRASMSVGHLVGLWAAMKVDTMADEKAD